MTKSNTKRALLSSVLAMILCLGLLIGTTFAWFTDSVTSAGNIIKSGTLDVTMEWADGTKAVPAADSADWTDASTGAIFNYDKWEPGYVSVRHIKIANEGTLALKYQLNIIANGEVSELADVIDVYYVDPAVQVADRTALSESKKLGTLSQVLDQINTTASGNLKAGENHTVTIALKMQESAGNYYQDMAIGSDFSIQLLATQFTYESDSFNNQYDANATLGTYVELEAGADLLATMKSAEADMPLTIKLNGNVEWPTEGHHGVNDITPASSIVIDGNGNTITATGAGVTPLGDTEAPMTLKNVKIVDESVSYAESAWEFTYLEIGGSSLACQNVTFADEIQLGTNATFTNCSFESNEESVYAVWVESGSATFTNCTFTGYRGLKTHEDYGSEVESVIVKDCTFTNITKKPGIALGTLNADTTVSITGSTFINCQAGDQGKYIYESDTDVSTITFTEKNNSVLTNVVRVITTADELFEFANDVNVNGNNYSGKTVILANDIDLGNKTWTPIGQTRATEFRGTFDGQGYTIKNLKVDSSAQTGEHYSSGLFGWAESHVTIRNVKIDGATVTGHHNVAALVGYTYSAKITNCHVSNATIVCTHANGKACGDKAGVLAGYAGNESRFTNCSATGCTVKAGRDAGQLIGCGYGVSLVEGCTASNVTVTATGDCTEAKNINNALIGRKIN